MGGIADDSILTRSQFAAHLDQILPRPLASSLLTTFYGSDDEFKLISKSISKDSKVKTKSLISEEIKQQINSIDV